MNLKRNHVIRTLTLVVFRANERDRMRIGAINEGRKRFAEGIKANRITGHIETIIGTRDGREPRIPWHVVCNVGHVVGEKRAGSANASHARIQRDQCAQFRTSYGRLR